MKRTLLLLLAGLLAGQNTNRPTTGPPEYEALQAHFDRAVEARQRQHTQGLASSAAWEQRKGPLRAKLERSLWHDWKPPLGTPRATITGTETFAGYTMENIVIESAPGLYSTSNLYLPRNAAKPYPVILYQCGHASNRSTTRS